MTIKKLDAIVKNSLLAFIFFSGFNITNCYAGGVLSRLIGGMSDDSGRVSVGDSYGGGTVFCVSQTPDTTQCALVGSGNYGLIMANDDQIKYVPTRIERGVTWASWARKSDAIPAAQSDDDGAANTAAIIAALPEDNSRNNAAWLAHNYQGGGNEDWYLPSKNELKKMYLFARVRSLIGHRCSGSKADGVQCFEGCSNQHITYWSSTEHNSDYAWTQAFTDGLKFTETKDSHKCVRAVRAFNDLPIQQFKQAMQTVALGMDMRLGEHSPVNLLGQHELQETAKYLEQAVKISGF